MLGDLEILLDAVCADAGAAEYERAVVDENLLDKSTAANRKASLRRLRELYALDPTVPLFRVFRRLWDLDPKSRPLLALLMAYSRDSLLRASARAVLDTPVGTELMRQAVCQAIEEAGSGKMKAATIDKVARNTSSSWSQVGHLTGRVRKIRRQVAASPVAVTFALVLGYVVGLRGKQLLGSEFMRVLDAPVDVARARSIDSRRLGLIELREMDDAFDVGLSPILNERELRIAHGAD